MPKFRIAPEVLASPETALFACDVAKDKIDLVVDVAGKRLERQIQNRTTVLDASLTTLACLVRERGAKRIVVLLEPTGRYHASLLRVAHRLGLETAWVSGEAVAKMRVVESNDTGKTDTKDPRVIHTLGRLGKTLIQRSLEEPWSLLRQWNLLYDAQEVRVVEAKCAIHTELKSLFPDFSFKTDFLFGRSGQVLMKHYRLNPYRIVQDGPEGFCKTIQRLLPTMQARTRDRLYHDAESSVKNALSRRLVEFYEFRLLLLWQDWQRAEERKLQAATALETIYEEACRLDPKLPDAEPGVVTRLHLARIVAETGPLSDFSSWRQLLRFAGLNLRERNSGQYRGQTRVSKKGRPLFRKVLSQAVLPLVRRCRLFGEWYHKKRGEQGMPGPKAMAATMRKFLKMLFGWYQAGGAFDFERVFTCESQLRKAA
jgi:transposase